MFLQEVKKEARKLSKSGALRKMLNTEDNHKPGIIKQQIQSEYLTS